ncbi:MAG: UDP-N-acetylmuramoyl-tripeptide--D-alanyl-D-alanine ligase [Oscillospiraceae bacterium]|nr:UDP-N-acetylmuramoyl-tripeptide--D-alanyl-D-alanine ligase [Oscillospiraceae bacterium]
MSGYFLSEISEWICADKKLFGTVGEIVTDSRKITPGCLFIALEGESFDGHRFIGDALEKGAVAAVAHKKGAEPAEKTLYVGNTERALRALARMHRIKLDPVTVGVTGSVGKTTTREMIAAVVRQKYHTLTTPENLNNNIGMPQTLLQLTPEHQAAVIEMGMTALGEIEELATTLLPQIGVITNIGVSHMERLGSQKNIRQAKLEIVQGLREGAPLLLNGDDSMLWGYENPDLKVIFYGIENKNCQITAKDLVVLMGSTTFTICYQGEKYPARIPCMGSHNVLNALAAFGVGVCLGIDPREAAAALDKYQVTGWRQKITPFHGFTVVEDCYNAGPESMKAALSTLSGMPCTGRRIAVLADMLELGYLSEQAHRLTGQLAGRVKLDAVYAYGEMARLIVEEAKAAGVPDAVWFPEKQALTGHVLASVRPGDILWVKGSHGMALETLVQEVYQQA